MMSKTAELKLTLLKSTIGRVKSHIASVRGLGLKKVRSTRVVAATPENLGMIKKVAYMLKVEEIS